MLPRCTLCIQLEAAPAACLIGCWSKSRHAKAKACCWSIIVFKKKLIKLIRASAKPRTSHAWLGLSYQRRRMFGMMTAVSHTVLPLYFHHMLPWPHQGMPRQAGAAAGAGKQCVAALQGSGHDPTLALFPSRLPCLPDLHITQRTSSHHQQHFTCGSEVYQQSVCSSSLGRMDMVCLYGRMAGHPPVMPSSSKSTGSS